MWVVRSTLLETEYVYLTFKQFIISNNTQYNAFKSFSNNRLNYWQARLKSSKAFRRNINIIILYFLYWPWLVISQQYGRIYRIKFYLRLYYVWKKV